MKNKTIKIRNKEMSVATTSTYETDFYKWTKNQSAFLEKGDYKKLDIQNLIEEIESLGRSERRALESYLSVLLMHLLKIQHQPTNNSKSWQLTIKNCKFKIKKFLEKNPSLKPSMKEVFKDAYFSARLEAAQETGLDEETFPIECPWTIKEVLGE